jgi:membrane associated rhomboid family serine protease
MVDYFNAAPASFILLAANVIMFIISLLDRRFATDNMLIVGHILQGRQYHRVITSAFLHAGPLHLLVNMLTLFFFAPYLEAQYLGTQKFLIVYFVSLVAGSAWAILERHDEPDYAAVGASGAVSGVLAGFSLFEPFQLIYLFALLPIPAIVFTVLYVLYSAQASGNEASNIGHEAHLGGAIGGFLTVMAMYPGRLSEVVMQAQDILQGWMS